jgi:hypothetical protein
VIGYTARFEFEKFAFSGTSGIDFVKIGTGACHNSGGGGNCLFVIIASAWQSSEMLDFFLDGHGWNAVPASP